jgi:hypothetical protein
VVDVDQRWTIKDLCDVASPSSGLHTTALEEFELKDGIFNISVTIFNATNRYIGQRIS